ncbi:acyltransferase [Rhizobiaceae bacterium n13]|uniref:Acyltransferase n=1 Tax=Ferirhizobium litorale TaxID=2927786 RepID=A0AAE3U2F8_9HYPH|nr:acyltransferase [Fererhizobium litorale]MDI7862051.1 acyltransferase [Fererhizobium litorale]MDI7922677.1 acyltransferase [Fererhizobium litorale]
MKTIYGIQYLRAAAALAVVFSHAAEKTGYHFAIGAAGVDIFFVISGFIMWVIAHDREPTPGRFLADRIRRIVPIYWVATGVMIVGGLAGLFPNLQLTVQHILASLFFVPMHSPSNGEIWPVLVQGWTLNFEMFFYLVFAVSLLLPRASRLLAVGLFFVLVVVLGAVFDPQNAVLATFTRPIVLEFVAGMLVGQAWIKGKVPPPAFGIALVFIAIAGFSWIAFLRLPFDETVCGPLAVALVVGLLSLEADGLIGRWKFPAFLGNASYSIYLWHTFAISVVAKVGGHLGLAPPLTFAGAAACGTILGMAAYLLLERPLVRFGKRAPASAHLMHSREQA